VAVRRAEAKPVEERHGPSAHRDDVAEDAADAGGGALERLYRGGVVVALRLERDRKSLPEVEHAGVLARSLEDSGTVARQALQEQGGVLVAAVLRPEQREHRELEVVRLPLEQILDPGVLVVREAELAVDRLFRDGAQNVILAAPLDVAATPPVPRAVQSPTHLRFPR